MIPYRSKGRRMSKETIVKLTTQYIKDLMALIQVRSIPVAAEQHNKFKMYLLRLSIVKLLRVGLNLK